MPMTAAAAACDDADPSGLNTAVLQCANMKPNNHEQHSAPVVSAEDDLALKRQRVKSSQNITTTESAKDDDYPRKLNVDQQSPVNNQDYLQKDSEGYCHEHDFQDQQSLQGVANPPAAAFLSGCFAEPLLAAVFGEPMSGYFQRLRTSLAAPLSCGQAVVSMEADGIYVHKRPIRAPNGANPLAVCGSVLHHVVVFIKKGFQLDSLDYGPANGADVTANILEDAPCKRVLTRITVSTGGTLQDAANADLSCACRLPATARIAAMAPFEAATAGSASSAPMSVASGSSRCSVSAVSEEVPYLYLGPAARGINDPLVQQLIAFAESRRYHALTNNCIHFADLAIRVMTEGAVRCAPLLYDMICGTAPVVDNPMLMMMQLMLRMSWFVVVDGSPLAAAFREHWHDVVQRQQRASSTTPEPPTLAETPPLALSSVQRETDGHNSSELATEVVAEVDTA